MSHGNRTYRIGVEDGNIARDARPYGHFETADRGVVVINGERFRCFQSGAPQGYAITLHEESLGNAGRYRDSETGRIIERTPTGRKVAGLGFDWREGVTHLHTPDGLMFHVIDDHLFSGKAEYGSFARIDDAVQVILDREIPESEHGALVVLLAFNYLQGNNIGFLHTPTRRSWPCS